MFENENLADASALSRFVSVTRSIKMASDSKGANDIENILLMLPTR
jgi:hypothetical protein